jgi:predicted DNA-binding transcriptional regulator AlpA
MPTTADKATPSPVRRLIDADQVAEKLAMSRRQVFRSADFGAIPPGIKLGRLRRWDEVVIDDFIAGGCRPPRREVARS